MEFTYNPFFAYDRVPRISYITYTGNVYSGLPTYNMIWFGYDDRIDNNTQYVSGASLKSDQLLKTIHIKDENNTVQKSYEFSYGNDNITSYLKEVVEKDINGTALNSTIFKYGEMPTSFFAENCNLYNPYPYTTSTGDFDGDGIDEVVGIERALALISVTVMKGLLYIKMFQTHII